MYPNDDKISSHTTRKKMSVGVKYFMYTRKTAGREFRMSGRQLSAVTRKRRRRERVKEAANSRD